MRPYARHVQRWISFDGPAPNDVLLRLEVGLRHGWLSPEEYRTLIDTPIAKVATTAPGGQA